MSRQQIELMVSGMSCAGCAQRAVTAARRLDGVAEASAEHATGVVRVTYDAARTDPAAVAEHLAAAGFPTTEPAAGPAESSGRASEAP